MWQPIGKHHRRALNIQNSNDLTTEKDIDKPIQKHTYIRTFKDRRFDRYRHVQITCVHAIRPLWLTETNIAACQQRVTFRVVDADSSDVFCQTFDVPLAYDNMR